ncbi:hypothetical protein TWF694_004195 [Orbilia ellipsospora]|uniref:Uncharacterized protein n=1 Tax=Orbilia ellipsospora TaxID=2528407 RepID=A0AAV9WX66_9PEZI
MARISEESSGQVRETSLENVIVKNGQQMRCQYKNKFTWKECAATYLGGWWEASRFRNPCLDFE